MDQMDGQNSIMNHRIYIRGSIILLFLRILLLIILFDVLYLAATVLLNLTFEIPYDWHHHISLGLLITLAIQILVKAGIMFYLVMNWMSNTYILNSKHVVKKH